MTFYQVMDDLLLNPATREAINQVIIKKPHAILLSGPDGSGKTYTAERLAEELMQINSKSISDYPYFFRLQPTGESIGIDAIRELHGFLQLRTTGKTDALRRIAIVENAHLMTIEAQNSLLKILEEPPSDTVILLTAQPTQTILGTVYSRVQHINIKPPGLTESVAYFETLASKSSIEKAYALSNGSTAVLYSLLQNDSVNPLLSSIENAKALLRLSPYERLTQIDAYLKDKTLLVSLIQAIKQIAKSGLKQASISNNQRLIKQWHKILKSANDAEQLNSRNVNAKLLVTNLMLNM